MMSRAGVSMWVAVGIAVAVAACGGGSRTSPTTRSTATIRPGSSRVASGAAGGPVGARSGGARSGGQRSGGQRSGGTGSAQPGAAPGRPSASPPPAYPHLLAGGLGAGAAGFVPIVSWRGRPAAWLSHSASGVTLMRIDQRHLGLRLHSGTVDAGVAGWRFGPSVAGLERRRLVAAFNGGFRLSVGVGGFVSYGHVAVAPRAGLGSIVTYADGATDIGAWGQGVPAPGRAVASVRQNLPLLIDQGRAAGTVDCLTCWGATLGGVIDPARSALGITANGTLIWAAGEHLTVAQLAVALLAAHAARAVELDINPEWVAGYVYGHRGGQGPLAPVPVMPAQHGIPGAFLVPWSRDFFTVVAR